MSITSPAHCTGSAGGCECEYSAGLGDFPVGKVGIGYTEKLDALRRWREMFFWVDDALVPWDFAFYTQGSLPRDERPPPGSYSMEDAELINENQMDLFSVVHVDVSQSGDRGCAPLRDGEGSGCWKYAGAHLMELVLEQPEVESTDVLAPTPLRSVPGATAEPPRLDATSVGSSEDADVAGAEMRPWESLTLFDKRTRGPHVEATSDSSAPVTHDVQSPPQTNPVTVDDILRRGRETGPKAFEGMPVDQLIEEFDMVTAQQAALVAQLRARLSSERGQSVQKDEEILLLKTQLADAQAEAESSRSYAQKLAEEKMALLVKVEQERADSADSTF
ncbi:hypothetical protein Tco_0910536 [Tanacetum coccineum]|uniref:Uncharacterized protein n=1 Tax=Tanacetum coccineum TaxID=301880 RepID=A0ABQ5CT53_9ASTR